MLKASSDVPCPSGERPERFKALRSPPGGPLARLPLRSAALLGRARWSACSLPQGTGTCCSLCPDGSFPVGTWLPPYPLHRPPTKSCHIRPQPFLCSFFALSPFVELTTGQYITSFCLFALSPAFSRYTELHKGTRLPGFCLMMYLLCLSWSLACSSMSEGQE